LFLPRANLSESLRVLAEVNDMHTIDRPKASSSLFKSVASLLLLIVGCVVLASCLPLEPAQRSPILDGTASFDDPGVDLSTDGQVLAGDPDPASSVGVGVQVTAPPLGLLKPATGLLPSGTMSVTFNLTTTAPANCRWSEQPGTPYNAMPYDCQQGQGTMVHSTVVVGLHDLEERWFYVRCQDLSTGRDPDGYERQTHLRVLGSWAGGYPRIAYLWGYYDPALSPQYYANYDLFIPTWWRDPAREAAAIRAINPDAKILMTGRATYGWPEVDPLTAEWWNSKPGDPGYNCLLRDSSRQILTVRGWGHPMYNLIQPYCRSALVQKNIEEYLSSQPGLGANLAYDGIFWDLLHDYISWLGDDIDSDLDGHPDDPDTLNAAYRAGVEDFLAQVRAHLPHVIFTANEAPQIYAPWINGDWYEWQLRDILNGADQPSWDAVVAEYRQWADNGQPPHTTFISSTPESIYGEKHSSDSSPHILPAFQAEATASYQRMRFGLASALMGDGLFFYDLREVEGPLDWYDEFGAPDNSQATTVPPRGYLGQPTGNARLLVDTLDTPDQILNGDFEDGPNNWSFWSNAKARAEATADVDPHGGVSDSAAAHITVSRATRPSDIILSQYDKTTVAGQSYTLSFWARSDLTRTVEVGIAKQDPPETDYGFHVEALVTPQWQHFRLWDNVSVTSNDGQLAFEIGAETGELWLDEVQLQAGALGVWARSFENGLAVVNTTKEVQTAALPGVYCKLQGSQAPLFQVRVDDDEAQTSAGWSEQEADSDQFGATVHVVPGGTAATMTYTPVLAYGGTHEVLAWVAPNATQSDSVSVTIHHAQGATGVLLNETTGEVGWHSLGTYTFDAGEQGHAVLAATGSGTVVADAFKWVSVARYNDGSQVSQVTLQRLDGIILLSSCYVPKWQGYLPLVMRGG
jgi:hypothetical protein